MQQRAIDLIQLKISSNTISLKEITSYRPSVGLLLQWINSNQKNPYPEFILKAINILKFISSVIII